MHLFRHRVVASVHCRRGVNGYMAAVVRAVVRVVAAKVTMSSGRMRDMEALFR